MNDASASRFDPLHRVTTTSTAYHDAVRSCSPGLPDWLIPASVIDIDDLTRVTQALSLVPGERFVDLGCGAGGSAIWITETTGASVIGVDESPVAVQAAEKLCAARGLSDRARFIVADIATTGLPDGCADGVMSIDALMFVDPKRAADEIARLLRPGRTAILRAVESLVEPFTSTLVRDYRRVFEGTSLVVTHHEELADYQERSLAFFQAVLARADPIRAEVGEIGAVLIDEAEESVHRATFPARVRTVYIQAVRR